MNNNEYFELMHHGIKGMKWGIRRTPVQLGHRPTAKKKRSKQAASKSSAGKTQKNAYTTMSNSQLREQRERLQLERDVMTLQTEVNKLNSAQSISRGKRLVRTAMREVVTPAAKSAGKEYLEKTFKKALNDSLNKTKKE